MWAWQLCHLHTPHKHNNVTTLLIHHQFLENLKPTYPETQEVLRFWERPAANRLASGCEKQCCETVSRRWHSRCRHRRGSAWAWCIFGSFDTFLAALVEMLEMRRAYSQITVGCQCLCVLVKCDTKKKTDNTSTKPQGGAQIQKEKNGEEVLEKKTRKEVNFYFFWTCK